MRRTVFSALALTVTAVLAGAAPAFADDTAPSPVPATRTATPSPVPSAREATPAPVAPSAREATLAPTRDANGSQVSVRPRGAVDTGVAADSGGQSGTTGLIGGGAAALVAGGGLVFVVRRRRATGA